MRPPGVRGNAIVDPAAIPLPAISSVPRSDTWCGFVLHLAAGTQLTLVIRTLVTCGLVAVDLLVGVGFGAGFDGAGLAGADATGGAAPPGDAVPPGLALDAALATDALAPVDAGASVSAHDSAAASVAAWSACPIPDRLWATLLAKTIPFRGGPVARPCFGGVRR